MAISIKTFHFSLGVPIWASGAGGAFLEKRAGCLLLLLAPSFFVLCGFDLLAIVHVCVMSQDQAYLLLATIVSDDIEEVKRLCDDPSLDVNWRFFPGWFTALFAACDQGPVMTQCLLNHPDIDVNARLDSGATPLIIASEKNRPEIVKVLLAHPGIKVNQGDNWLSSAFLLACQEGHIEVLKLLLADPEVNVNCPKNTGESPLYKAAQESHLDVIQYLLASPRDIDTTLKVTANDPIEQGLTAAMWARLIGQIPKSTWMRDEVYEKAKVTGPLIADLIDDYDRDPAQTRYRLRHLPGIRGFLSSPFSSLSLVYPPSRILLLSLAFRLLHCGGLCRGGLRFRWSSGC